MACPRPLIPPPLLLALLSLLLLAHLTTALPYDPAQVDYNLNTNQTAITALDYSAPVAGENQTYHPSPPSWRFPIYTTFLDRFVNGDPGNDNANGTLFEMDLMGNQMRHGGDIVGVRDGLDYLQGMGVKGVYLVGSPFVNMPWGSDGYSPLDLTLLDRHFGTIQDWRDTIQAIHDRGMYVILDNTFATLGDLLGFDGFLNASAPFKQSEYTVTYKTSRQYADFNPSSTYLPKCQYPRFWGDNGFPVGENITSTFAGCYDSDFDQYGEPDSNDPFYPDYRKQLTKFAGVQDRLREWRPDVRTRLEHLSCLTIAALDIDGYRIDKAAQVTVDALADWADAIRACASDLGKDNFFIMGEVTGPNTQTSIYVGRGRQPDMLPDTPAQAIALTNATADDAFFVRAPGKSALDAAAFHYSTYRAMLRFLGMDGRLANGPDAPLNWVDQWTTMLQTNDLTSAITGAFDPRHMFGVTNQDLFRWPAVKDGLARQMLGLFITTLHMPGIPALYWGEEQGFYLLDNTASNYLFGRQPMSASVAWQNHGCYKVGSYQFPDMGLDKALHGCEDDWNSLDHRDPSSAARNVIKTMYAMRANYPVLNDGVFLKQLSNQTRQVQLPFSEGVPTEVGLWSTVRGMTLDGAGDLVWLVYHNDNVTVEYVFDCQSTSGNALISPFPGNTTVRNLFPPFEEVTLDNSATRGGVGNSSFVNGCVSKLELPAWGYKLFVPTAQWKGPGPMVTKFSPGHDARIESAVPAGEKDTVEFEIQFSEAMDCTSFTDAITVESVTEDGSVATIDASSLSCTNITDADPPTVPGAPPSVFSVKGNLNDAAHGIHTLVLKTPKSADGTTDTGATDRFYIRLGAKENPIVFPRTASYSKDLLHRNPQTKELVVSHAAPGASKFRYSLNFGTTYSDWLPYTGGNTTLDKKVWSGTKLQAWKGEHVQVQYWSAAIGSSSHIQHGDIDAPSGTPRRFPHLFAEGAFNMFGFDSGVDNKFSLDKKDGLWKFNFFAEWPTKFQINVWGLNPDGKPDITGVFGDVDQDGVLDRLPPNSLSPATINTTVSPPSPFLAYRVEVDDSTYRFKLVPVGSRISQMLLYFLLAFIPILIGAAGVFGFMRLFYQIEFNEIGKAAGFGAGFKAVVPIALRRRFKKNPKGPAGEEAGMMLLSTNRSRANSTANLPDTAGLDTAASPGFVPITALLPAKKRRTVLIATMEYDIEDWGVKVKIGGLGVMAQLMGKNLGHQDLIWVVPCVGGIDYPPADYAEPITVIVLGQPRQISVTVHILRNITYVLLDAPVFRQQTKSEPYPPRMDDLDSAIYYSAWNQCIAEVIRRYPVDLYHINDYHGAVAPLYLLPQTIPCCLSLHNAEFQGLWPMRNAKEKEEVCAVYHLPEKTVEKYVQFGDVFNLLHAGASYLRIHQKGFGAVGVSASYGKRSWARYPIFWGLPKIGKLPNPDPTDLAEWTADGEANMSRELVLVDPTFEAGRAELKRQAQEWANLDQNPAAELFVFVGRWSMQKGVDLIADIFPTVLEENPNVQLICVGPVIDLYGKFAALKLGVMMKKYPGRVFSKPEFTALPPYIFSGAEFALIPSRDEPFGLVAVEFGRKGALGVGAKVGGLGQMPGWWYTVESTTTSHLIHQFKKSIKEALASKPETRAMMRARSAKQRFPVAQWVGDLEVLQTESIKLHEKEAGKRASGFFGKARSPSPLVGFSESPGPSRGRDAKRHSRRASGVLVRTESPSPGPMGNPSTVPQRTLSLGVRTGPGRAAGARARRISRGAFQESLDEEPEFADEYILTPEQLAANASSQQQQEGSPDNNNSARGRGRSSSIRPESYLTPQPHQPRSRDVSPLGGARGSSPRRSSVFLAPDTGFPSPPRIASPYAYDREEPSHDSSPTPPLPSAPFQSTDNLAPARPESTFTYSTRKHLHRHSNASVLSVDNVTFGKEDFALQDVDPSFTDKDGSYYRVFEKNLEALSGKTSTTDLCIETYLVKAEKLWFDKFRAAKLKKRTASPYGVQMYSRSRNSSIGYAGRPSINHSRHSSIHSITSTHSSEFSDKDEDEAEDEFLFKPSYEAPRRLKKIMQYRILDWPIYSIILALGQILAANSYQISLLTGSNTSQTITKFYIIAAIYIVTSVGWYAMYRRFKAIYVLSLPFALYGWAFFMVGMSGLVTREGARAWMQNIGTASYAIGSSSGSLFFALNFGDEGGSPIKSWVYRACVVQGTQQLYAVALWYWGSRLTASNNPLTTPGPHYILTAIMSPIAALLFVISIILYRYLPAYYHRTPGSLPSFYPSLFRRKIVVWFFVATVIQNYFLSAPYARSWTYLWSSQHVSSGIILILVLIFFVGVWAAFLALFARLSTTHSWILPIFAIALGSPKWAQLLWATSGAGSYLPWLPNAVASALAGRGLWLWLGVLDSVQGVGFGMILLQTLTRVHVAVTLVGAQVLGTVAAVLARGTVGDCFPDVLIGSAWLADGWFWAGLSGQAIVCLGFFWFFRGEQLSKP